MVATAWSAPVPQLAGKSQHLASNRPAIGAGIIFAGMPERLGRYRNTPACVQALPVRTRSPHPMHCHVRRLGSWIVGSVGLVLAPIAKADPGALAFRLEADYGVLTNTRIYEGTFTNGRQALQLKQYRTAAAGALGMRATGGYVLKLSRVAVYPRLSIAYVPNQLAPLRVRGDLDEYAFEVERRAWSIDAGAELQFLRRQFLLDGAIGIASTHSSFRLPGYAIVRPWSGDLSSSRVSDDGGLLLHVATGWRSPLSQPVTFGVKVAAEAAVFVGLLGRVGSPPLLRATLSLFVEWEPPPPYTIRSEPRRSEEVL